MLIALGAFGCGSDHGVEASRCDPGLRINEVAAAGGSLLDVIPSGREFDWVELFYDAELAEGPKIDLGGYVVSRFLDTGTALPVGTTLARGEHILLAATVYEIEEPTSDVIVLGFDLNRDGDVVFLYGPGRSHAPCGEPVDYPDQHKDYTWIPDVDLPGEWCAARTPTPGDDNDPCLCKDNDEC